MTRYQTKNPANTKLGTYHRRQPSSITAFKSTLTALVTSLALAYSSQALAHGGEVHMVPLEQAMATADAEVKYDSYANVYTITKNSTLVRIKPESPTVTVNGKSLAITTPLVVTDGQPMVADTLVNEVLQSGLDQTFKVEQTPHPLNTLSGEEINKVTTIIRKAKPKEKNLRFSDIRLKQPDKDAVWRSVLADKPFGGDRVASFTLLKGTTAIEGEVDLTTNTLTRWTTLEDTFGMVLYDDFMTIQEVIQTSPEYKVALKKHGVDDVTKVVGTPLTVGYFGGEDGLQDKQQRILKIVSYLDVGDGNYWAHPIENWVAVS